MTDKTELDRLENISGNYESEKLAGANELYHIYVRDSLIPQEGGESALELGCGKGLWTKVLCERYDSVDIVDGSGALLEKVLLENRNCRANVKTHEALVEDFIQAADSKWQHIYMTFLLEHLHDPVTALRKIKDRLSGDGCLFVAVPNADSLHRIIALRMGMIESTGQLSENDKLVGHRRIYTLKLLREQLTAANFRITEEKTVGLKPLNLGQMEDWSDELVKAFCKSGDLTPDNGAYITMKAT